VRAVQGWCRTGVSGRGRLAGVVSYTCALLLAAGAAAPSSSSSSSSLSGSPSSPRSCRTGQTKELNACSRPLAPQPSSSACRSPAQYMSGQTTPLPAPTWSTCLTCGQRCLTARRSRHCFTWLSAHGLPSTWGSTRAGQEHGPRPSNFTTREACSEGYVAKKDMQSTQPCAAMKRRLGWRAACLGAACSDWGSALGVFATGLRQRRSCAAAEAAPHAAAPRSQHAPPGTCPPISAPLEAGGAAARRGRFCHTASASAQPAPASSPAGVSQSSTSLHRSSGCVPIEAACADLEEAQPGRQRLVIEGGDAVVRHVQEQQLR
jgi:hypothetical protein